MPFQYIANLFRRFRALRKVRQLSPLGFFVPNSNVKFSIHSSSRILVAGKILFGFQLSKGSPFATFEKTVLHLGENSEIIFLGSATIAPGVSILVGKDARLVIGDQVIIAHNTQILCNSSISIGKKSMISWNSLLIDNDSHDPVDLKGKKIRLPRRALKIGNRVGLQANVLIPRGVTIGDDSVVSAGTILRMDVPPSSIVYSESKLKIKKGFKSGI